ncbi:proteinase T-like protein [Stachybotrys elegans]|uniref:Proteinase T-like protein n=1 Tax=Stachybotrys elegans TaxID=80388 RepID=A0A8K0STL3_9HYPO|nr:proteinase T-like protein [Stachybotrys elegans]
MRLLTILPLVALASARAPLYNLTDVDSLIPDKYIVRFKDTAALSSLDSTLGNLLGAADYVYAGEFRGFTATLDQATVELLRDHQDVEYIEQDAIVTATAFVTQPSAPWNLGRISRRARGATSYVYDNSAGIGTCVYILDTGIDITHPEFGGRAILGPNFANGANTDGNGHGTAVAGVVGSSTYGVAKLATVIGVRVLDANGSGTISGIIAGLNWVGQDVRSCPNGRIVNISLGGGFSAALNNAVTALVNSGFLVAVAAGNSASNVANFSPASAPLACTVGSSDRNDVVASSSNFGPLLDVFAPGRDIVTTWPGGGTQTLSGSSMSAPHVAGLGAYLASLEGTTPSGLCARIQQLATPNILTGVPAGTLNLLIFNGNPSG